MVERKLDKISLAFKTNINNSSLLMKSLSWVTQAVLKFNILFYLKYPAIFHLSSVIKFILVKISSNSFNVITPNFLTSTESNNLLTFFFNQVENGNTTCHRNIKVIHNLNFKR